MATPTIEVASDAYLVGVDDCGTEYHGEVFFVQLVTARGERWRHEATFAGCETGLDPEGFRWFRDVRPLAKAKAEAFAAQVRVALEGGRRLSRDFWVEVDPVYGSDAYISKGTETERWLRDREEAMG